MSSHTEVVVVGGGVVGLAVAARLSETRRVALVERHARFATETSGRNSGVIHAGLYYPPGSKKARLCVEGRERLYRYCAARGIPHRRTGKLVLATAESEIVELERIAANAHACGVEALDLLDAGQLARREPLLRAVAAVYSTESGIVDAHLLTANLLWQARDRGCDVLPSTTLEQLERTANGYRLVLREFDGTRSEVTADAVVNAAGLEADRWSAQLGLDVDALGLRLSACKGDYFVLARTVPKPTCPLVYPVPSGAGLGIHLTSDLGGMVRAGPDAEWVDTVSYEVAPEKRTLFADAVRRYFPSLRDEDLAPDFAGVRPKLARSRQGFADFVIEECTAHGLPGYVQLVGIESPGLTASLAIAEEVARHLDAVP